jgi:hypothetical protein
VNTVPWRLIDNIYWHTPDKTFEPCICTGRVGAKQDRVQVLLPATFPKLWGRNFKSPPNLNLAPMGALLFGHSTRFPLRWCDRGDPEEGQPDQELRDLESSFYDSGMGTSLESSSLGITDDSSSRSPTSHASPRGTSRFADVVASEYEQPLKKRKLQKETYGAGESSNMAISPARNEGLQSERHHGGRLSTLLSPIHSRRWRDKRQDTAGQ